MGMLNVATCAVAAARIWSAIFGSHIFACLLYGTLYAESLHILVGGYLRLNVMPLDDERERHSQDKEPDSANRYNNYH